MNRPKINSNKTTQVGFFKVTEVNYDSTGVVDKDWTYLQNGEYVAVLVLNLVTNSFVFVKQVRIPIHERVESSELIETVAGIHDQPTLEETVYKELEEELDVSKEEIVSITKVANAFSSPGIASEFGHYFFVNINKTKPFPMFCGSAHEKERIEPISIPIKKALSMLKNKEFLDNKALMLLFWWIVNEADVKIYKMYKNL